MKNLKNLLFLLVLVASAAACKKAKTASGYTYKIIKSGSGAKAAMGDIVSLGMLLHADDSLLFSTAREGRGQLLELRVEDPKAAPDPFLKVIQEALAVLKLGDSATFVMPLDTFKMKPQGFEKSKAAKFTITLHKIKAKAEVEKLEMEAKLHAKAVADSTSAFAKDFATGKLPAGVKKLPSGLQIAILSEGAGPMPQKGQMISVNYCGAMKSGKIFDESYSRGQPIKFPVGTGGVIPGWDEGLMNIKEGTKAIFFVPSKLGYGAQPAGPNGELPANSDLIFYVEVLKAGDAQ